MSEKEVREAAERALAEGLTTIWSSEWTHGSPQDQLKQVLSQPPDLVVLLRWAKAEKQEHERERQEAQRKRAGRLAELTYDEETSAHIYGLVVAKLEKTVRLTDDRWEWVDD